MEEAEFLADSLVVLKDGELIKQGTPSEIRKEYCYQFKITFTVPQDLKHTLTKMNSMIEDDSNDIFDLVRNRARERMPSLQEDYKQAGIRDRVSFSFQASQYKQLSEFVSDLTTTYNQFNVEIESNKLEQAYLHMFQSTNIER